MVVEGEDYTGKLVPSFYRSSQEGEQKGVPIDIVAGLNAMDAERGRAVDLETPLYGAPDIRDDRLTELHSEIREKGDQSSKDLMDIVDFTKYADLQAFQKDMQQAYGYIATHIKYMNDARALMQQRGFYGGGSLPAPYVIDRSVWKDDQKPRIYHPRLEPALDLFVRFRAFDFSIAHICRYIESKPYIFKVPSELDQQRYMFLSRMHLFHGGYKFSDMGSVKEWLSNLTLEGYAKVGKDEEGNILYMPNAFEAAIPYELLDEVYAAITGHHIDGTPFAGTPNTKMYMRSNPQGAHALFHGLLTSKQGHIYPHTAGANPEYDYQCLREIEISGHVRKTKFMTQSAVIEWSLRAPQFDRIVADRLFALSEHDNRMAARVKKTFD